MEREHCPVCAWDATMPPAFQAYLRAVARDEAHVAALWKLLGTSSARLEAQERAEVRERGGRAAGRCLDARRGARRRSGLRLTGTRTARPRQGLPSAGRATWPAPGSRDIGRPAWPHSATPLSPTRHVAVLGADTMPAPFVTLS